jgi:hypothetical protein
MFIRMHRRIFRYMLSSESVADSYGNSLFLPAFETFVSFVVGNTD